MTNWEKYNESIKDMDFAVKDGKVVECSGGCLTCELAQMTGSCSTARVKWLKQEYIEPKRLSMGETVESILTGYNCDSAYEKCSECPFGDIEGRDCLVLFKRIRELIDREVDTLCI